MREPNLQKVADLETEIERLKGLVKGLSSLLSRAAEVINAMDRGEDVEENLTRFIQQLREAAKSR